MRLPTIHVPTIPQRIRMRFVVASSYVYFIQEGDDGPIKIGHGWQPFDRLAGLQVGNPRELRMVGYTHGTANDEREVHTTFAHLRLRGEWFSPADDLIRFIASRCSRSNE